MKALGILCSALVLAGLTAETAIAEPQSRPLLQTQGGYNPPPPKDGFRYPDCFCTDSQGKRIELGQTTCLKIGSQQVTARCDMSLNNPTWRRVSDGCPSV